MKKTYFFNDKPLFGIDIRPDSVRIMQSVATSGKYKIKGYGSSTLGPGTVKDGVIINVELVAKTIQQVMSSSLQGKISTRRVALSIPASRTFSRAVNLPILADQELRDAVMLETEQYTPVAIDNLYVDFTPIHKTTSGIEVFTMAVPKQVVESYLQVAQLLNLDAVLVETRVDSIKRLFAKTKYGGIPSVLIDFDKETVDISIIDKNIIANGTVSIGANFSQLVADQLRESSGKPMEETPAQAGPPTGPNIENQLQLFIKEIRRMIRYYEERYDKTRHIEQIVLFGNEAIMPNIVALMTEQLRLPVRSSDLWQLFSYDSNVSPIPDTINGDFLAVAGLSVARPEDVFL